MKYVIIFLLFISSLYARFEAKPAQECEAFNNMKHTQNTHHILLDTAKEYTVLKHHKGQNLILIKGENPSQRWVDDSCFSNKKGSKTSTKRGTKEDKLTTMALGMNRTKQGKTSKQNLLVLSWHNAFCETHKYKKECKKGLLSFGKSRYHESHFVLHGLWPQPKNKMYCGVDRKLIAKDKHKQWSRLDDLDLSASTVSSLKKIMPGFSSHLHKHEWIKHGTCYGTSAEEYYKDALVLTEQVNHSKVGDFFATSSGKIVTLKKVRELFDNSFGKEAGEHVEMKCRNGLVTELWLHLGSGSKELETLLKNGKKIRSRCYKGRIDKAGFGR